MSVFNHQVFRFRKYVLTNDPAKQYTLESAGNRNSGFQVLAGCRYS